MNLLATNQACQLGSLAAVEALKGSSCMVISDDMLIKTCKNMIETILLSLPHATKGTIYQIGPMPDLRAVRVTSGAREGNNGSITWGLPGVSDYNFPGKSWEQYRDSRCGLLEAMGWCVERQKSWTADNPQEDARSVRKQLLGAVEDRHHMEPVLVRKWDLYGETLKDQVYPVDWRGESIWQDTDYAVVAVIKIHFHPDTITRGDRSTKIIKKLSRSLGTELFSLHLRETLLKAREDLSTERMTSYNALVHELRNILIKLSFISSVINTEISYLREQWEHELIRANEGLEDKSALLSRLNILLERHLSEFDDFHELAVLGRALHQDQAKLAELALLPEKSEQWLNHKIKPKWARLLAETPRWSACESEVRALLERLPKVFRIGTEPAYIARVAHLPADIREQWSKLAYIDFGVDKVPLLDDIMALLERPEITMLHKRQSQKILSFLKALVEIIPEVESRTNRILSNFRDAEKNGKNHFLHEV